MNHHGDTLLLGQPPNGTYAKPGFLNLARDYETRGQQSEGTVLLYVMYTSASLSLITMNSSCMVTRVSRILKSNLAICPGLCL